MNDWECPCCHKILYDGGYKLRHLAKHIPALARLMRKEFIQNLMLGMQSYEKLNREANNEQNS